MRDLPAAIGVRVAYRVAKLAIEDAGIHKEQIGAVLTAGHIMGQE